MKTKFVRPNWDKYFMEIAHVVKTRSNCSARQVGAIIVKDRRIIATGYNGTPMGIKNCFEEGCERCSKRMSGKIKPGEDIDKCICLHAEQNALLQSAYHGISTKDTTIYTTDTPCNQCAKMIINSGVKKIISENKYPDDLGLSLLKQAGISLSYLKRKS